MPEPLIVVAVVNAAGGMLNTLLAHVLDSRSDPGKAAKKVMAKTYEQLATAVTTNSLRVLIVLSDEHSYMTPDQVASNVATKARAQEPDGRKFEKDPEYRLRFLQTLGLVDLAPGEVYLTELGSAFIDHARIEDRRYRSAFRVV